MKLPKLTELADSKEEISQKEFGSKTKGLVTLLRGKEEFKKTHDDYFETSNDFIVPEGIVIPKSYSPSEKELKDVFDFFSKDKKQGAIITRSSHENEEPGKYDSLISSFFEDKEKKSFNSFLDKFEKVRSNPLKPVIIQNLIGRVYQKRYDPNTLVSIKLFEDMDYEKIAKIIRDNPERENSTYQTAKVRTPEGQRDYCTMFSIYEAPYFGDKKFTHADVVREYVEHTRKNFEKDPLKNGVVLEFISNNIPKEPYMGEWLSGFTARSQAFVDPNVKVMNSCYGLTTRLVNGTDEFSLLLGGARGWRVPVSTGNDYKRTSQRYFQKFMDVFDLDKEKIVQIYNENNYTSYLNSVQVPFGIGEQAEKIFDILTFFENINKEPIELEGSATEENLYIYQLTSTCALENIISNLSVVGSERIVMHNSGSSYGSINFKGDVLVHQSQNYLKNNVKKIVDDYVKEGKDFLYISNVFADDILKDVPNKKYVCMGNEEQITRNIGYSAGGGYTAIHAIGHLVTQLYERIQKGDKVVSVLKSLTSLNCEGKVSKKYSKRVKEVKNADLLIFEDMRFESTKGASQLYFD